MRRVRFAVAVLVAGWALSTADRSLAQVCLPTFGYGNVGYSAGYSIQQVGWCGPRWGGWCGPRWGWGCRPWGWRSWCVPPVSVSGCSYGWPAWVGTTWFPSCNSVWMSTPCGGSFFSGGIVPYPTIGYPVVVPGFVSSTAASPAVAALASARPAAADVERLAATIRDLRARREAAVIAAAPRGSSPAARLRAARQVAVGDRHLRAADGDPGALRRAVDAYRRAAAIAGDQPDTYVREAIALVALGERGQADAAMARASALDGRLAAPVPRRAEGVPDPVFGDRPAGSPAPLAVRGQMILRQIAAQPEPGPVAAGEPVLAGVTARWAERFATVPATIARR